jgi:hypothetical protein
MISFKKMTTLLSSLILLLSLTVSSQSYLVHYNEFNHGKLNQSNGFDLKFIDNIVHLSEPEDRIRNFMDYKRNENVSIIEFEGNLFRTVTSFDSLTKGIKTEKTDTVLNQVCKHISFKYFSNSIDVFYVESTTAKGIPFRNFFTGKNTLALKVIINGNRTLIADKISEVPFDEKQLYPYEESTLITTAEFEELKIRSRYQILPVFNEVQINFDPGIAKPVLKDNCDETIYHLSNGTVVLKKICLPDNIENGAYTFLDLSVRSNGDAYDRTGSVFMIRPGNKISMLNALQDSIGLLPSFRDNNNNQYHGFTLTPDFEPEIELMRFFTSFGVDHFNKKREINNYPWFENANYKQDVSELITGTEKEIWIGVFIGNYDKGGHIINLNLNVYPAFEETSSSTKWIQPLFNTVNIMEMSGQNYPRFFNNDTLVVDFEIPELIKDLQLLYTATGHGGWGNGDEFNPKLNQILIDGKEVYRVVPWRTDCGTYRLYNPASGNFENGLSSSDLSRSNWCPATLTPPDRIPLGNIGTGKHRMEIIIDQGADEGSSFNAWNVSGILTGNKIKK